MPSLFMHEIQEGEGGTVEVTNDVPPFPSLRSLDFDVADLWCHSLLEQPIERNVEDLFEELEKIIPRLTPLNMSNNVDNDEAFNDGDAGKATEQTVGIRMRMLEVLQDVLTLEFEEDETDEGSETQTSTPPAQLIFSNPNKTAEEISKIRDRLRILIQKLKAVKEQRNDNDYHHLRRSLLVVEEILNSEASLAAISNEKRPARRAKATSATKSSATKNKWLDQLSETLKTLTKTFLDDKVPVPDGLASVASFVLQLAVKHQTASSPPSPSPLTQDSAIADRHDDDDDEKLSDEEIAKVQKRLHNLYGRPSSPFYIAQLQEDARQLLVNWSTKDLEIPKLIQLGYLTGQKITTGVESADTSFDTAVQGAVVDVQVQTESSSRAVNDRATIQEREGVARRPQNDSDSETTLGDTHRKKKLGRPSEVVDQIWGTSKRRRNADTNGILVATEYKDDEDDGGGKPRAASRKQKRRNTAETKLKDPPAAAAGTRTITRKRTSPSNLKQPPQYPPNAEPTPAKKPISTGQKQVGSRRASEPAKKTSVQSKSPTSNKRSRSQEPSRKQQQQQARKKRKSMPTEADIIEAIRQGIDTYGYGNWTMIQKRSGGILKHLKTSQIRATADSVTALTV